ncbi:hypothetical protein NM208_g13384 [Fusarium decemcellulare]|uniref:Uncharacterized protein n=1 Tax=Fusarium decemcellulare TaxID=57161 RepID=A0ACC1RLZ4_9HYPO|nr:hypothetical protein NM208_g13384 [Fusarium decemcellulare]
MDRIAVVWRVASTDAVPEEVLEPEGGTASAAGETSGLEGRAASRAPRGLVENKKEEGDGEEIEGVKSSGPSGEDLQIGDHGEDKSKEARYGQAGDGKTK